MNWPVSWAEATLMKGDRREPERYLRFLARMGDSVPAAERTRRMDSSREVPHPVSEVAECFRILLKERDVSEMKRNGRICWPECIWNGGIANRPERTLPVGNHPL